MARRTSKWPNTHYNTCLSGSSRGRLRHSLSASAVQNLNPSTHERTPDQGRSSFWRCWIEARTLFRANWISSTWLECIGANSDLDIANLYSLEMQYFLPELNGRSVRILPVRNRCSERQVYGYGETSENFTAPAIWYTNVAHFIRLKGDGRL
jgi:hypothetical protein